MNIYFTDGLAYQHVKLHGSQYSRVKVLALVTQSAKLLINSNVNPSMNRKRVVTSRKLDSYRNRCQLPLVACIGTGIGFEKC